MRDRFILQHSLAVLEKYRSQFVEPSRNPKLVVMFEQRLFHRSSLLYELSISIAMSIPFDNDPKKLEKYKYEGATKVALCKRFLQVVESELPIEQ